MAATDDGRFEPFFEKFVFPPQRYKPTGWVRVEYTAALYDAASGYTGDALGVFTTMDREVTNVVPTTIIARWLLWVPDTAGSRRVPSIEAGGDGRE